MICWEEVRVGGQSPFKRAKVATGWVVLTGYSERDPGRVTFLQDPDHAWDGEVTELR